jgi:hypothetical protein
VDAAVARLARSADRVLRIDARGRVDVIEDLQ